MEWLKETLLGNVAVIIVSCLRVLQHIEYNSCCKLDLNFVKAGHLQRGPCRHFVIQILFAAHCSEH